MKSGSPPPRRADTPCPGAAWKASGQIPERAVRAGRITRFGSLDSLEGGHTARQNLIVAYEARQGAGKLAVQGYASRYRFKLYSNFTYFLEDPVRGDMIELTDARLLYGLDGRREPVCGFGTLETLFPATLSWRTIFDKLRPDLIVCDHSPVVCFAAYGRIPVVQVGDGFTIPPAFVIGAAIILSFTRSVWLGAAVGFALAAFFLPLTGVVSAISAG